MLIDQQFRNRTAVRSQRKGTVVILGAILCMVLLGMVAFAVDIGYVCASKEEIQRSADAAALAACWEYGQQIVDGNSGEAAVIAARGTIGTVAGLNDVVNQGPLVDQNASNAANGDVVFGYSGELTSEVANWDTSSADSFNMVKVKMRRDGNLNGEIPLFFARVFGKASLAIEAEATAGLVRDISGFKTRTDGGNIDILPIALDKETFDEWLAGNASDDYSWDASSQQISSGADGVLEVDLYPKGNGSPGNRGMVDIGSNNNSTSDIARQILYGISTADLSHHGGSLVFDSNGELFLNGDTGISAGVKDELFTIRGEPRIIPIFSEVNGPGNNAIYTIVQWFGIRIMDVKLTGPMKKKHVTIQAAPVVTNGVVPSETTGTSSYVYSPVVLLQ